jgi:hypothetical protein
LTETDTAGSKAPADVRDIAGRCGYQLIRIHPVTGEAGSKRHVWSTRQNLSDWETCYETIPENSVLLLQHPFWLDQPEREITLRRLKEEKQVRIIAFVHDVEKLRGCFENEYMRHEFEFMLQNADVLIVHNVLMADFFAALGIPKARLVSLNIFDYLAEPSTAERVFDRSLVIAGNLDSKKSGYLSKLAELKTIKIHLFGPHYEGEGSENVITYHGTFPMEQIAGRLTGSFGLVWDGDELDTCAGAAGGYLRYNSPHKLSLYLAAGIPVILWDEAAEAGFVREHGVGFTVSSLRELPEAMERVTDERYSRYLSAVEAVAVQLRQGEYTKKALCRVEELL